MKKTLLILGAGVLAIGASAQTYKLGEAFAYEINPSFHWFGNDDRYAADAFKLDENGDIKNNPEAVLNINWPAFAMDEAADLATNTGLATPWLNSKRFATVAEADETFPVVEDPWTRDAYAVKVQSGGWWGYGNLNFALPKMDEVARIRVIYRAGIDDIEKPAVTDAEGNPTWVSKPEKPFWVRLTDTDQDGCFAEPRFTELNEAFWDTPGYRVIDLYYQPNGQTYLALTFDSAGLTCQQIAFYLEQVSVVPVSKIAGDTHIAGDMVSEVRSTLPELVKIEGGEDSISEIAAEKANTIYDLQGRKVAKAGKGLFIINGVKTLVK